MTEQERILDRAAKLKAMMDGARVIGSDAEAEAFAGALNRLLLQHELSLDEVAYAKKAEEPLVELQVDFTLHGLPLKRARIAWQELLAHVVARSNMCISLGCTGRNQVWFAGTREHAEVAGYLFATLARTAAALCERSYRTFYGKMRHTCATCGYPERDHGEGAGEPCDHFEPDFEATHGYREGFLSAFTQRIAERFREERRVVDAEPGTGLMRIDNALQRVRDSRKDQKKTLPELSATDWSNRTGAKHGRTAADAAMLQANGLRTAGLRKGLPE